MHLDEGRYERQKLIFSRWRANNARGLVKGATGFGKTFIFIMAIKNMNENYPTRTAIVLVPNTNLLTDWNGHFDYDEEGKKIWIEGHIQQYNLKNTRVWVINSYVKYIDWQCDFLCIDEVHRVLNEDAEHFSKAIKITKYRFILVMTATLTTSQEAFLLTFGIKLIDEVTEEEATKNKWIAPATTYNLGIELTEDDQQFNQEINDKFNKYFAKFNHQFALVNACNAPAKRYMTVRLNKGVNLGQKSGEEWRKWFAEQNGWRGEEAHSYSPANISRYAAQCMFAIRERKQMWQKHPAKIGFVSFIIKKFNTLKTIIFSQNSDFADLITNELNIHNKNSCLSYHTKIKSIAIKDNETIQLDENYDKEAKQDLKDQGYKIIGKAKLKQYAKDEFNNPDSKIKVISAVKALDEGADFKKVDMLIFAAYDSVAGRDKQRNGRGKRVEFDNKDKRLIVVYLYMIGTQEKKWLDNAQDGRNVRWINDINNINVKVSLGSNETIEA